MSQLREKYVKNSEIMHSIKTTKPPVIIPYQQGRFTKKEWHLSNDLRCRDVEDQQKIADRVLDECERIKEQTEERTKINKETTDRRIFERIQDVQFNSGELQIQRKEICLELEALGVYKTRLIDCLHSLSENSMKHCEKCLILREGRVGIDLIVDEVEVALHKEINTILHWQNRLEKSVEQTEETIRRLRAVRYALDGDLELKEHSMCIEREGANLQPTDLSLAIYKPVTITDPANVSKAEWEIFSIKNIQSASKEIFMARPVRIMIDNFLKQISEDLEAAYLYSNRAFQLRISEIKKVKQKLEEMLAETLRKIEALTNSICMLEKALNDKHGYIALANVRQGMRAHRPGVELVKDAVCQSLHVESEMLKLSTEQLQKMLEEAQISLRYLLQSQIQLEEDIKIKTNSLKIDEVECMTVRESMNHFQY